MKNLELSNYGVQEMNSKELSTSNGGGLLEDFLTFYEVAKAVAEADATAFQAYVNYSMKTGGAYVIHTQH